MHHNPIFKYSVREVSTIVALGNVWHIVVSLSDIWHGMKSHPHQK